MEGFEWDEDKQRAGLVKHGVDFAWAARILLGEVVEWIDSRVDYGEARIQCLGELEGRIYVVVYTWRGETRRIVSARKANLREARAYRSRNG